MAAHRLAWELANGPIPVGLHVLHRCDNPGCVRPAHLFLGTNADNCRDKALKGRSLRGERNAKAKLTEADVREIRRLGPTVAKAEIAQRFGITRQQVVHILSRAQWKHVRDEATA